MTDDRSQEAMQRLLRLLADRLETFLEGDDFAFETLGEAIEEAHFTSEEVHAALMILRAIAGGSGMVSHASVESAPGRHAQRVWSHEERESLTPEAWGFLLDLRRRGALDPGQFERVLDVLTTSGLRPAGIEVAREVATRVALHVDESLEVMEADHGDVELSH